MNVRIPKHFLRLFAICLVLATPIVTTVVIRNHDGDRAIAAIATERTGLRCAIIAVDLLTAIEHFRLSMFDPPSASDRTARVAAGAIEAQLVKLDDSNCSALATGPRTSVAAVRTQLRTMLASSGPATRARMTLRVGDAVLGFFPNIEDASALTYDPTVHDVDLIDALVILIPALTERLDQSAEILEVAAHQQRLVRTDIISVEKLSGKTEQIGAMTNDDFDATLLVFPALRPVLSGARAEADRTRARLAAQIDLAVAGGNLGPSRDLRGLRLASIAASQALVRTTEGIIERSFDARIAALKQAAALSIGGGALALAGGAGFIALLWRAQRRRDRAELERAQGRAQILETKLARHNAEAALYMTERQFRAVFDGSHVGIAIVNRDGRQIEANAALRAMFDDDLRLIENAAAVVFGELLRDSHDSHRTQQRFERPNGVTLWGELSLSIIRGSADDSISAILLVHDITEHKTLNARLDHETLHDALTGLPNRVYFMRRLNTLIQAGNEQFSIVFVDLDHFKQVNDTLGHHAGDDVLRLVALRLAAAMRPSDFVARLHGDEFAVLLANISTDADCSEIDAFVARLHRALELTVETPTKPIRISASIGYIRDGHRYRDPEQLLRDADSAMYSSKIGGRNRTTVYEAAMNTPRSSG